MRPPTSQAKIEVLSAYLDGRVDGGPLAVAPQCPLGRLDVRQLAVAAHEGAGPALLVRRLDGLLTARQRSDGGACQRYIDTSRVPK